MFPSRQIFFTDAVLFDMDGTLTDSISAVEAAWGKVAQDIGQDPEYVVAATHGKRAADNLSEFKPYLREHEMDIEVADFEESILFFADAYKLHGLGSSSTLGSDTPSYDDISYLSSAATTPALTPGPSAPQSRRSSNAASHVRRPSFGSRLLRLLDASARYSNIRIQDGPSDAMMEVTQPLLDDSQEKVQRHHLEPWQLEAASVDRSVRILPGVRKMLNSIPVGRYAIATSGAKTYAYGCMSRVGIIPPAVTITADDRRLKAGKPAPDPFLLAAECLGYDASKCVVFEDSPSGIRAGVASGAIVIAVCTSHERRKIENCGAHYLVENMEKVSCEVVGGRLRFTVDALE